MGNTTVYDGFFKALAEGVFFNDIRNLCPFSVVLVNMDDQVVCKWPAAKSPASIYRGRTKVPYAHNDTEAMICTFEYGATRDLPDFKLGVGLIVTAMILDRHRDRPDLLLTDGSDAIRDKKDPRKVVAVRRLLALNIPPQERK